MDESSPSKKYPAYLNDRRAALKDDSTAISPVETLRCLADELERGDRKASKLIVLTQYDSPEEVYDYGYRISGMKASEVVALLEAAKQSLVRVLNGEDLMINE